MSPTAATTTPLSTEAGVPNVTMSCGAFAPDSRLS